MPRSAGGLLQGLGHVVDHVRDIGLGSAPDAQIAANARKSGAVLLTRDMDFADIRLYPPAEYQGIVVFRVADDAVAADIVRLLRGFIGRSDLLGSVSGRLAIVESGRVRFRPPL